MKNWWRYGQMKFVIVSLGIWFWMVLVCGVTTLEIDVSFWYPTCLGIPGLLVWTRGLETFDCSTALCLPAPCRLWTWLPQWQTLSSLWICWLSSGMRGSVLAQSPYRGFIPCPVGTEVVVLWSECGCSAGTLQWVGGCTSHPVVCWQIGGGTGWVSGWHIPFVHPSGGAKL